MAYIERETAIDEIDKWLDSVGSIIVGKGLTSYGELVGCLEDTPAADVVEVVRCKDCKHYDIRNAKCLLHSEYADQYSSGFNFEMYSKDYCSYGELKEREG